MEMRRRSAIWTLIRMFAFSIWVYGGSIFMPHKKLLVYSCHPPRPPIKPLQLWTILELEYGSRPIIDFFVSGIGAILLHYLRERYITHIVWTRLPWNIWRIANQNQNISFFLICQKKPRRLSWKEVDIDLTKFYLKFSHYLNFSHFISN